MVRLDAASRVVSVDMEGVQVGADLLRWGEVLDHAGAGVEDFVLHGAGAAGGWCFFAAHVLFVCAVLDDRLAKRGKRARERSKML